MKKASLLTRHGKLLLALAIVGGLALGIGAYTFEYAEGLSYLSTDPRACVNCHIMQPQFDSWQKASHHTVAGCVDCHLPAEGIEKWIAKASNGWHHSKGFTFQDFEEPIRIKGDNARILQNNCLRCHTELVHDLIASDGGMSCVHCHRGVGHGETLGLGGADRGFEQELHGKK
ncbi:MAG: cytochrome c nitrite reductase small subunit [Planctomycetia bacterium]